jgi:hypothetical protein
MTSRNVSLSGVPLTSFWLVVTIIVGALYPIFSERPALWLQAVLPPLIGVIGGWISFRLFGGSFWQRLLSVVACLLWVLFLVGWGWSVSALR